MPNSSQDFNAIDKIFWGLEKILRAVIFVLAAGMLFCGLYQVVGRYILKISTPWTEELLRYLYVLLTYGACGLCVKKGSYICITIIYDTISGINKTAKTIVFLLMETSQILFFLLVTVLGLEFAMANMNSFSTANHFCLGVLYLVFPFGGITGILFVINEIRLYFRRERRGHAA